MAPPGTLTNSPTRAQTASSRRWLRSVFGLVLAVLGGLALVASFPPVGAWPLIFVAFVPIAIAQHRVLAPRWAGLAPMIGVGAYIAYLAWGGLSPSQRWWLLLLIPLLLATGWLDRRAHSQTGAQHLWWSSPVMWTGALFAVGLTPIASWLDPAYALYRHPLLIQPVSVFAVSGLNLVILLTNYGLAAVLLTPKWHARAVLIVGVVALLAGWIGTSSALLSDGRSGQTIRVAVIQPGRTVYTATTPAAAQSSNAVMLAILDAGTRRAARDGARLVVWPEEALQYIGPGDPQWQAVQDIAAINHVYLVLGYSPNPRRYNQAAVLSATGQLLAVYNKQHPVSFAGDHSVGGPVIVAPTDLGVIAPIICYDLDYENTARATARKRAQLLAVPSEDWSGIAGQHYTHLVFRAVENRVAAAKADSAWDSTIIDPQGRILAAKVDTSPRAAVLVETVPLGTGTSPFVTTGNWIGWTCLALSALWTVIATSGIRRNSMSITPSERNCPG